MNSIPSNKIISFVYLKIMQFPTNEFIEEARVFSNFLQSVINIMHDQHIIHHSHTTGKIKSQEK